MPSPVRKILVTSALPYANGSLHLGHLIGYIQSDIWVRFLKMHGHHCIYVCGSDAHGTPIMIQAEKLNIPPEQLVKQIQQEQESDFKAFHIEFDNFYTTHSPENKELIEIIFQKHLEKGNITKHTIKQLFDPQKNMFLPDRFIKGECPRCKSQDQYGDNCENCGATYLPTELKNPYSTLSGAQPIEKESEHYFFNLKNYENMLRKWTHSGHLQEQVANKLDEWFNEGLQEWDISRDSPYFGFTLPGESDKYFYCWMDAPVGYLASFKNYCNSHLDIHFSDYLSPSSKTELYHFIGKDIIYFHALFWPAMLEGAEFRTPTAIFVNGFLTINGQKMSKSRGTFIKARTYLNHFNPEYLRYYYATKLSARIEDLDINFDDFIQRINSDLVGKFVNIASRCASFINKYFNNQLSDTLPDQNLFDEFSSAGESIANKLEKLEFSQAIRQIMSLADRANQYIDEKKPWALLKNPTQAHDVQAICTMGINLFRVLMIYLKPVLPETAKKVEHFLNIPPLLWEDNNKALVNHIIKEFEPLAQRLDKKQIEEIRMATQLDLEKSAPDVLLKPAESSKTDYISIDDFAKIDLRVAKVLLAEHIEGADKLLRLELEVGDNKRQVFAGIKSAYAPENLIGQFVVIVANLEPRKMRFGMSEGMVLAASDGNGGKDIWLIKPDQGAKSGMKVK